MHRTHCGGCHYYSCTARRRITFIETIQHIKRPASETGGIFFAATNANINTPVKKYS